MHTLLNHIRNVGSVRRAALLLAASALLAGPVAGRALAGTVQPPSAVVRGYSLDDMASAVANFSLSGNNLAYYPDTPFQILYRQGHLQDPLGTNTFTVAPGTAFYLKYFFIDDAAPIIGTWPGEKAGAADYIFGRDQLGAHGMSIEVDGQVYSLDDPGYIGGPVPTPDSPDGSLHMLQVGAFITPLPKGVHKVIARGTFDGTAFVDFVGGPVSITITYNVIVE